MAEEPKALPELDADDVEELRLALVMNGGVSLAVWIGGVASEINRLTRAQGAYGDLLRATGTSARADVISGTSAGGINGALVALAAVYDADLASLRDVWLEHGALERLLRSPIEADPPSLLKGNDYFLAELRRAFAKVRQNGAEMRTPDAAPIELTLTTTLLRGRPNRLPDDFGTVIADVNHRGSFVFRRGPDTAQDSFADDRVAERLAFAARATASFPVAFEPVFYSSSTADQEGAPVAADTRNLEESRFLLDGGILDNKPLESAIEAIFAQRAKRDVRRILAYIVPNPGASARIEPDQPDKMPGIAQVALASLTELPRVESISAQIEAIKRQNQQVRRKHQSRAGLMTLEPATLRDLAIRLFPVYHRRRLESSLDYVLPEVSAGLVMRTKGKVAMGRRLRDWLMARFLALGTRVPWAPTKHPLEAGAAHEWKGWRWGVFTLENMTDVMLDLLRRAMRLTAPGGAAAGARQPLMELRQRAYDLLQKVRNARSGDGAFWRTQSEQLVKYFSEHGTKELRGAAVDEWIAGALDAWQTQFIAAKAAPLGELATQIATVIRETGQIFRTHFADADNWPRAEDREAHGALRRHVDALAPDEASVEDVLRNLLVVEVALNAFGSYREVRDQYVEMIQVSADAPTSFDGPEEARRKLAGAQLANFGAFLKRSWRANDWMFGRLDGAERLCRVVLNPDRLRRLYSDYGAERRPGGAARAREVIHWLAVQCVENAADQAFLQGIWRRQERSAMEELAFLDTPDIPVPEQLPVCAAAVIRRIHLEVLRAELPVLADAVRHDLARGGNTRGSGPDFLGAWQHAAAAAKGQLAPEAVVELFARCRVGEERIRDEVGSDLVTSVTARALAVSVAAGAGEHSRLGPVRRVFKAARVPAIAFDFFAQGILGESRTMVALFSAALVSGALLLALGLTYLENMPGALRSFGAALVVITMAIAFLRRSLLAVWITAGAGVLMTIVVALNARYLDSLVGGWGDEIRLLCVLVFLLLTWCLAYAVSHRAAR